MLFVPVIVILAVPLIAPSAPVPQKFFDRARSVFPVTFRFAPVAWLYCRYSSLSPTSEAVVSPAMSVVGVTAIGFPDTLNQTTCVLVPLRYVSSPLAPVIITLFAVSHVLVPPTLLSLVDPSEEIEDVLLAMRDESPSRAVLIDPEVVARANICASVILKFPKVDCRATTVCMSDSSPVVGVGICVSSGIFFGVVGIMAYGL